MQPYTLQHATPNDSDFFYNVKKTVLRNYIEEIWGWDEAFQIEYHKNYYNPSISNIIHCNGIAAGTVEIKEDDDCIFISGLYLLPAYQGKRVGSAIINECLHEGKLKYKRVALEVLKINIHAQRLYSKLGFTLQEGDDTKFYMYKDFNE
jgi:ribosomal protein S18 acetylase RimI-like enzyme